jgi:hypothetical protein
MSDKKKKHPKGYHKKEIKKGEFGKFSKIKEEFLEFEDAYEQDDMVMQLCEMSDILGAMKAYLNEKYGGHIKFKHLIRLAKGTHRAFLSGERTSES